MWGQAPAQAARLYGAFPFTPEAGGSLGTSTPPTLNLLLLLLLRASVLAFITPKVPGKSCSDEPSLRVCMSIHFEGESCCDIGSNACSR